MTVAVPKISVLLPCYNAAETLEDALKSLVCQTLQDFEVVAVDDGSQDESLKILRAWQRRDAHFRVFAQAHQGIISALNNGLAACKAPYIARMDTDDRSHPQRLARQFEFLETHSQVSVVGCLVAGFPRHQVRQGFRIYMNWLNSLVSDGEIRREIFVESPLAHPSVTFRKDVVQQAGGYQEHGWAEDYDLWLRLYLNGALFAKVPEILLDWREHPERLTRTDGRYSLENFLRAKAHYLVRGPLRGRDGLILWGAGMIGRRLSKHLLRQGAPLDAFIDIDPRKIGRTRRGFPILAPEDLENWWTSHSHPVLLSAVGARGARKLIRERLNHEGLFEGHDWWSVA